MSINSDVVVRIGHLLGSDEQHRLQDALRAQPGVLAVKAVPRARQLLVVNYDASCISALGILRCVRAQGYPGRLIGM